MNSFIRPDERPAWQALVRLAQVPRPTLRELLLQPQRRLAQPLHAAGIALDASHQCIDDSVHQGLLALAEQCGVISQAQAMARGEPVNTTEGRAALHMALRGSDWSQAPWSASIRGEVAAELDRVCDFADAVRQGSWKTPGGSVITDVVNIGIGGSDLGPRMAAAALADPRDRAVRVHFVSNPDAFALDEVLARLNAASTGFIIQSKSFTTQETLTLAASARRWLRDAGMTEGEARAHFAAVSASPDRARQWGVEDARVFRFHDWVGGRYSVWSSIGLPVAVACGAGDFRDLLAGAHAMDRHFLQAPAESNLPLQLALHGIWNRNFLGMPTLLLCPYTARLVRFVPFVQQMDMESNGKRVHVDGSVCNVETGPVVWGGLGIDGQHAYFQLLHQGTHRIPVEFIGVRTEDAPLPLAASHHQVVTTHLGAQAQALATGRSAAQTEAELRAEGTDPITAARLAPHRTYPGDIPSSTLWMERLDARGLGALMALYEHKVFCQAAIWGINPFDQWGVELGKRIAAGR